jgi:serine/threonine protein kinase
MVKDIATGLYYVHHEYEPMVLHRDIKASNVMIDSTFQARLGDFGLACVVANGKNSYTDLGAPGTIGFMAPAATRDHRSGQPWWRQCRSKPDPHSHQTCLLRFQGFNGHHQKKGVL